MNQWFLKITKKVTFVNFRFKELRKRKGISQEELRQEFNLRFHRNYTPSAISLFENEKRIPEISALVDFADYFEVSLDYLIGRDFQERKDIRCPLSDAERDHVRLYRSLSVSGRAIVDGTTKAVYDFLGNSSEKHS